MESGANPERARRREEHEQSFRQVCRNRPKAIGTIC